MVKKRNSSPDDVNMRKAKVKIKQKLADLLDYMDTLDRRTWDELGLYKLYNIGLDTFNSLYGYQNVTDSNSISKKTEDYVDEEIY